MQVKYSVVNSDFYNFDKTGFSIDIIISRIVIIYINQYSIAKRIQLGNWEQVIVIVCVNSKDWDILLFLVD